MAFLDPFKSFLYTLSSQLQSQYYYLVVGVLGLLVVTLVTYAAGWGAALYASPWFWVVVALLLAVGIFVGVRWGIPWLRERYFLRRQDSAYVVAGQESPEEFQAKFLKALQTLKGLPQLRGKEDPLYALPWYLLIGESHSGKTTALQGADLFSPLFPPSGGGATQNCEWWVSNTTIILDTAGRYALPVDMAQDRAEWYRLLRLLCRHREQGPINGLILTIAADKLALQSSEEQLRADASKLRERIEEAVRELGIDFPIYVLITKCDLVEGFGEFFGQLPERVRSEVIGYIDDPPQQMTNGSQPPRGPEVLRRVKTALQDIYDRLHLFRLSLLESKAPEILRPAFFCFPEEFKALCVPASEERKASQPPLITLIETLFSEDVRYHTPLFRGIFFSSAKQQGAPFSLLRRQLSLAEAPPPPEENGHPYFLHDLFRTILPRDRSLVRTTERAQKRRQLSRGFSIFAGVGLVVFLALLLFRGFTSDRRIASMVNPDACPEAVPPAVSTRVRLQEVEACRQAVQRLIVHNRQRPWWSTLIFNSSGRLEEEFRHRYIRTFQAAVLTPLNSALERAFRVSSEPLPLVLLVAQRVRLNQQCLSSQGCSESAIDELQPDSGLMLNPQRDRSRSPQEAATLQEAYSAYLLWQHDAKAELQHDLTEDSQRLQRWLAAKQFNPDQLLAWVNTRSSAITYEHYWELPALIKTVTSPQIEAACTNKVWEQDIAPFLQQIQDAVPEVGPQLRTFRQKYLSNCFVQWQRFLAGFPQGAERWKGPQRQRALALRLLTEHSPYQQVVADAATTLAPWLPTDRHGTAPDWAYQLRDYTTSEQQQAYQEALATIGSRLDPNAFPASCFKLAQETFTEGKPTAEATNPVLRAWWLATQPDHTEETLHKADEHVWGPLLWEPVRYVWRVLLDEAGRYMQANWREEVNAPLQGLPPAEQVVLMYGPGGKVSSFVEQFVRPFLTGKDPRANVVLGESMPFSSHFLQLLWNAKALQSLFGGGSVPQPVQIHAPKSSRIEGIRVPFVAEETVLSVACAAKTYRVTDRSRNPNDTTATVLWSYHSCGEVTITISIPTRGPRFEEIVPGGTPIQLTKRYTGQMGFLYFLQDFLEGSHRFTEDELTSTAAGASQVQPHRIRAVQVHYDIEAPSTLKNLLSALQNTASPTDIIVRSPPLA